jgi:hypothetical protein
MKRDRLLMATAAPLLAVLANAAYAQSDVFVCLDDQGHKTYQNTGAGKGCKRLEIAPVMTVPAPKLPVRPAATETRPTPASFPRVDGETQKSRDGERRRILEDELKSEEQRLAQLRAEFNNGEPERQGDEKNYARYQERVRRMQDDIQRVENNITALKRELALLRQ